jgi:putative salt-induced outer membrane protein
MGTFAILSGFGSRAWRPQEITRVDNRTFGLSALALAISVLVALPAAAGAEENPVGFNGRAAFSFAESRGNTDNQAITGEAEVEYRTDGPWVYDGLFGFVTREEDSVRTEERYDFRATANYFWTADDYLFGRFVWRKDNFGSVREETVPSVGYGRVLIQNDKHSLKGEIALGYRFAELSDGTEEEGVAVTTGARYLWNLSETTDIFQNLLVQWSSDNTFVESETGLTTNLVGNLNGRVSYRVRHNTDVPVGTRNSDFLTTIGVEYKF